MPKGYAALLAKQCDCHENTVYNVLHKSSENETVSAALIELARKTKEEKKRKDKEHKRLEKIAQQL
ncbi:MAG TPA: hypothetical protein VGK59_23885 [Ohtaekwangia sp.]